MIELKIDERDYEAVKGELWVAQQRSGAIALGEVTHTTEEAVKELAPAIILNKLKGIMPSSMRVAEVTLTIELAGQPFGVGISSTAEVKLVPMDAARI